jgi:hypothetical protein
LQECSGDGGAGGLEIKSGFKVINCLFSNNTGRGGNDASGSETILGSVFNGSCSTSQEV